MLPAKVFATELKLPLTVTPDPSLKEHALAPKAAERLLVQALAVSRELPIVANGFEKNLAETRAALAGAAPDALFARLIPLGRARTATCTLWLADWSISWPDTLTDATVLFTSKIDGKLVDAAEITDVVGGAGVGRTESKATISASGEITTATRSWEFEGNDGVEVQRRRSTLTVGPDCKLTRGPSLDELVTVRDLQTGEQLTFTDDGNAISVAYRAREDAGTRKLDVRDVDRDAGTLTVRFGAKARDTYPLEWAADRRSLSCTNPDGGVQRFTRL